MAYACDVVNGVLAGLFGASFELLSCVVTVVLGMATVTIYGSADVD